MKARDLNIMQIEAEEIGNDIVSDFLLDFYGGADRVPQEFQALIAPAEPQEPEQDELYG